MSRPTPSKLELAICALGILCVFSITFVHVYRGHDGWACVSGCTVIGGIVGYLFRGGRNHRHEVDQQRSKPADVPENPRQRQLRRHWRFGRHTWETTGR